MEKEFEALEIVYNNIDYLTSDVVIENDEVNSCLTTIKEQLPIIEQALTELKAIKEAKPSEAMEELEQNIKDRIILAEDRQLKLCTIIKQALLKAQELEKVLEIIFEKQVDIMWFYQCVEANKTFEDYNSGMGRELEYLTEEEFNLIKRCSEK